MTPFYAAHGIEPLLPFDITEVTFLTARISKHQSIANFLTVCAYMLQEQEEDLVKIHDCVLAACYASRQEFERKNINCVVNYNSKAGELVLVLNKKIEPDIGQKYKPCYFGPIVVVTRLQNGIYILSEVDGAVLHLKFAAFYLSQMVTYLFVIMDSRSQRVLEAKFR